MLELHLGPFDRKTVKHAENIVFDLRSPIGYQMKKKIQQHFLQISFTISAVEIYFGRAVRREVGCEKIQ